jgi:hypothetical protein
MRLSSLTASAALRLISCGPPQRSITLRSGMTVSFLGSTSSALISSNRLAEILRSSCKFAMILSSSGFG